MNIRINNRVVIALCVAALVMPALTDVCHAMDFEELARSATSRLNNGWGYVMNSFCYIVGAGLLIGSLIFAYRKHNRMGGNDGGYGKLLTALVVGTCLLALPYYEGTASSTLWGSRATITGEQQTIKFDQ